MYIHCMLINGVHQSYWWCVLTWSSLGGWFGVPPLQWTSPHVAALSWCDTPNHDTPQWAFVTRLCCQFCRQHHLWVFNNPIGKFGNRDDKLVHAPDRLEPGDMLSLVHTHGSALWTHICLYVYIQLCKYNYVFWVTSICANIARSCYPDTFDTSRG